jgi:hypothetical protein
VTGVFINCHKTALILARLFEKPAKSRPILKSKKKEAQKAFDGATSAPGRAAGVNKKRGFVPQASGGPLHRA